mmetsp:Transcript_25264/g.53458  ORF Transcript_25264/g.53458 Transcript_25264/m.53458 type:complete len:157 (-) Transcript_25264:399-869(-)
MPSLLRHTSKTAPVVDVVVVLRNVVVRAWVDVFNADASFPDTFVLEEADAVVPTAAGAGATVVVAGTEGTTSVAVNEAVETAADEPEVVGTGVVDPMASGGTDSAAVVDAALASTTGSATLGTVVAASTGGTSDVAADAKGAPMVASSPGAEVFAS